MKPVGYARSVDATSSRRDGRQTATRALGKASPSSPSEANAEPGELTSSPQSSVRRCELSSRRLSTTIAWRMPTPHLQQLLENALTVAHPDEAFEAIAETVTDNETSISDVEAILRFMEEHPDVEFGVPGALVHAVEKRYGSGYEEVLEQSVARKPTSHTRWMLQRVINGTKDETRKLARVSLLARSELE